MKAQGAANPSDRRSVNVFPERPEYGEGGFDALPAEDLDKLCALF
jgi:hypothetical protein